jgi:hypothetical protein
MTEAGEIVVKRDLMGSARDGVQGGSVPVFRAASVMLRAQVSGAAGRLPKTDRQPASVRADPHPRGSSSAGHMLTLPVGVGGGATGPHVVRMRRSIRIANPLVPAAEGSRGPTFAITEFATDSPLEEDGFELLVRGRGEAGCRAPGRSRSRTRLT